MTPKMTRTLVAIFTSASVLSVSSLAAAAEDQANAAPLYRKASAQFQLPADFTGKASPIIKAHYRSGH